MVTRQLSTINSNAQPSNRKIGVLLSFLLLAWLTLAATAQAQDSYTLQAGIADAQTASTGQYVSISVVKKFGDAAIAGEQVDWTVSGDPSATLSVIAGKTSAAADGKSAGIASTRFMATAPGHYLVTATSRSNPGCVASDCASISATIGVDVVGNAATSHGSGSSYGLIGAGAAVAAVIASSGGGNSRRQVTPPAQVSGDITVSRAITIVSGDGQAGFANSALPLPLVVRALDDNQPANGVAINWTVNGGATLSASTSATVGGNASILVTNLGPGPGPVSVTATRADSPTSVITFTLLVDVPSLGKVSGDNQNVFTNAPVPNPLVVDARLSGSPQAGLAITWAVVSGSATIASVSNGGLTDASGQSSASINIGATPGTILIKATRSDRPTISQTFSLFATRARTLVSVSGGGQTGPTDATLPNPLVVLARDNGIAASGKTINWTVSGSATLSAASSITNGSGNASVSVTFGASPGTVTVTGTRADEPAAFVNFTLTSTLTRTLAIASGNGQSGTINGTVSNPLVVIAKNNGLIAPGITINWLASGNATLSASSSVTDAMGNASVTVTSLGTGVGPVMVTAKRADDIAINVIFNLSITPSVLSVVSGNNQSGLIGSAADLPLVVRLQDGLGADVSGQTISWSVIGGSASLTASSSVTGGTGQASVGFSFGVSASPITIRASAYSGLVTITFSASPTNTSTLTKVSGDGQSGAPGATLPLAFVVQVTNPVIILARGSQGGSTQSLAGVPVSFAVISGSATILSSTGVTDASGNASAQVKLGLTPGPVVVRASVPGGPIANFSATVTGSLVPGALTIISGNNQTLTLGIASQPMVIELRANSLPLAGATITWSTSGGSVASASSVTDASGRTSTTVTPNSSGAMTVTANFPAFNEFTGTSITFTHNTTIASLPGLPTNEVAVAVALDSACTNLQTGGTLTPQQQDLLNQCRALGAAAAANPAAVAVAIEEMLPDVAQTQTESGQAAGNAQSSNLAGRISALRGGAQGLSFNGLALAGQGGRMSLSGLGSALTGMEADDSASESFGRWGFFMSGTIGRGDSKPGTISPGYDFDIDGITAGVDYRKSDNFVFGVALGYTSQNTTLAGGQGAVDTSGFSLSGYSTWYHANNWYMDSVLTFARNSFDSSRLISYVLPTQTVSQLAIASSNGDDVSGSLTFGRDFNKAALNYGVYGRLSYSRQSFDGFDERVNLSLPGAGLALHVEDRDVTAVNSVLGGKISIAHSTSWGVLVPLFELEWQKEYNSDPDAFQAYFLTDPTKTPIIVVGDALDSSFFRMGAGLSAVMTKGRSGFIMYERIFSRDRISQDSLALGFRVEF